jgi:sarcosine oxidase subunit gamma
LIPKEGGCVVDLKAKSACDGLLPLSKGRVQLSEVDQQMIWSVAPLKGQEAAVSKALKAAFGVGFPAPGAVDTQADVSAVWSGLRQAFVLGADPREALAGLAAVTDQSDAWAIVDLTGAGAEDVLARLVPMDLRATSFAPGTAAKTQLNHMNVLITRHVGGFRIMAFRSMARTLAHELAETMGAVAARRGAV